MSKLFFGSRERGAEKRTTDYGLRTTDDRLRQKLKVEIQTIRGQRPDRAKAETLKVESGNAETRTTDDGRQDDGGRRRPISPRR